MPVWWGVKVRVNKFSKVVFKHGNIHNKSNLLSPKIKRFSAKTRLSSVLLIEINSPDLLNIHSDGTEDAVMQINILDIFAILGAKVHYG